MVSVIKVQLVIRAGLDDILHFVRRQASEPHTAIRDYVFHKIQKCLGLIKFYQGNSNRVECEIGQIQAICWNTLQKITDFFRARLIKESFEPDIRINEVHSITAPFQNLLLQLQRGILAAVPP